MSADFAGPPGPGPKSRHLTLMGAGIDCMGSGVTNQYAMEPKRFCKAGATGWRFAGAGVFDAQHQLVGQYRINRKYWVDR
jgi:hypothetical protein